MFIFSFSFAFAMKHRIKEKQATISMLGHNPFNTGSNIIFTCENQGQQPVRWFKNGFILDYDIENNSRMKVNLSTLFIAEVISLFR